MLRDYEKPVEAPARDLAPARRPERLSEDSLVDQTEPI